MGDNLSMNTNRHFERATINIQFTLVINARRNLLRRSLTLITELLVSSKKWPYPVERV